MKYRWSASFLKKYKLCPFQMYCKMSGQELDTDRNEVHGKAGNVVHNALQYYYEHLKDFEFSTAVVELENVFNSQWDHAEVDNQGLDKNLYWLSVLHGAKKDLILTDCEMEIEFTEPFPFVSYIDVVNTETHMIGDWKTSTYKSAKVEEYRQQLLFYTYAYKLKYGVIPTSWVMFNKVNKTFPYEFTEKELKAFEKEMIQEDKILKERILSNDFPRQACRDACHWCPYKKVCSTDLLREPVDTRETFKIVYTIKDDKLLITGSIPEICHEKMESHINFEIKNAHFIKAAMAKKGIKFDGIKRSYYRKPFGAQTTPGYMNYAHLMFGEFAQRTGMKYTFEIKDLRNKMIMDLEFPMPLKLNIPFEFYELQNEAVDTLIEHRWGAVEVGTGGGKTAIAAEAIRRVKARTLFVIDNKDLLMQTKKEYETMLEQECGVVGMGKEDWDKVIVVATIQTLAKRIKDKDKKTLDMLKEFSCVVFDEIQILASKSFEMLSKKLINTKYRFGFSATAKRDDGATNLIFALTGEVVYKVPAKELTRLGILVPAIAEFYKYEMSAMTSSDFNSEYVDLIVENPKRNELILKLVEKHKEKQILIVCRRTKHCEFFLNQIPDSRLIYGQSDDKIRENDLQDFIDKKFKVLISNIKIFNKGLNIKALQVVINASANGGEVATTQTIGRGLRKNIGKDEALYIDFIDQGAYMYDHSMTRIEALRDEGYTVIIINSIESFINE